MVNECSTLLLSFVVPCYNVEQYLQRCLDSIYSCGLPEEQFEVVCVNDCSPDGSEGILESNQVRHSNLRIIKHEQNKGLGGARNTGINEAKGKYLWFVDSDDEIIGDGVTDALKYACTEDLDVLCFNYRKLDASGKEIPLQYLIKDTLPKNGSDFAKTVFRGGISYNMGYVVRFLYKSEYLRQYGLYFPQNVCWEDTVYMPKSIINADRVAAVSSVLYSYWMNKDSISGTFRRFYPAKQIYDFAFCTGVDLLQFSEQIEDAEMRQEIYDAAVNRYINRFPLLLLRTGKEERKKFFEMVKSQCEDIASIKCYINKIGRVFLMPIIGPMLATVLSFLYKKTHYV